MNIIDNILFKDDKPAILSIKKTEKLNQFAVGLSEGQLMSKHKTPLPTTLIVLKGVVDFSIEGETLTLNEYDTYEIPVNIEHEVKGKQKENVFMLVQEK